MGLPYFCPDPYFDLNITWWAAQPDLTDCFKQTILRMVPCGWLVLAHLFGMYCLLRARRPAHLKDVGISGLQISRIIVTALFAADSTADLIYYAVNYGTIQRASVVFLLAPAIEIATMLIAIPFYLLEYNRLRFDNPAFFVFWFLEVVEYALFAYFDSLNLNNQTGTVEPFHAAMDYGHLLIACIAFILECFSPLNCLPNGRSPFTPEQCRVVSVNKPVKPSSAKHSSKIGHSEIDLQPQSPHGTNMLSSIDEKNFQNGLHPFETINDISPSKGKPYKVKQYIRKPCPEETASHASRLTFAWLMPLLVTGLRKTLKPYHLWLLRKPETTAWSQKVFAPKWNETLAEWKKKQAALEALKAANPVNGGLQEDEETTSNPRTQSASTVNGRAKGAQNGAQNGHAVATDEGKDEEKDKKKKKEPKKPLPPLFKCIIKVHYWLFLIAQAIMFIYLILLYLTPVLLWALIDFMTDTTGTIQPWKGYLIGVIYFLVLEAQSFIYQQHFHLVIKGSVRVRASLIDVLYKKALTIAPWATSTSSIINMLAVDLQRFQDMVQWFYFIWYAPLNIVIAMVLLYIQIGWVSFVGLGIMFFTLIFNGSLAGVLKGIMARVLQNKDRRVKFMTELLNGIKVVKLAAWEPAYGREVVKSRKREVMMMFRFFCCQVFMFMLFTVMPTILTSVTLLIYTHVHQGDPDNQLTPARAFVTLYLYQLLQMPLAFLPMLITFLSATFVAINRMGGFLCQPDLDKTTVTYGEDTESINTPIQIENGAFAWSSDGPTVLRNINLKVKKGELVAVVGIVGSGKSSLVQSFLGEMVKKEGTIKIGSKSVAYVAQQAWIQNATLRENILFGLEYDKARYESVLDSCALRPDLQVLMAGDMTEIGERGINLSGGQRQRVSVARAVYANADIYILDDPLSAVDVHVGKHLFEQVIYGENAVLRNKTRVLVTHGIQYLPKCDRIVCIADGEIREQGTYQQLISQGGQFSQLIYQFQNEQKAQEEEKKKTGEYEEEAGSEDLGEEDSKEENVLPLETTMSQMIASEEGVISISKRFGEEMERRERLNSASSRGSRRSAKGTSPKKSHRDSIKPAAILHGAANDEEEGKLIQAETAASGRVKWGVYFWYLKALGYIRFTVYMTSFIVFQGVAIYSSIWLQSMQNDPKFQEYAIAYVMDNITLQHVTDPGMQAALKENMTAWMQLGQSLEDFYLWVYFGLGWAQAVLTGIYFLIYCFMIAAACQYIHNAMLERILHAPMSFFDTTPIGRILNRFSKDLDMVDFVLPMTLRGLITMIGSMIAIFIVVAYSTPIMLAIIVPVIIIYLVCIYAYLPTSRQIRRIESITRSPVFDFVQESINGSATIRAYRHEERFIAEEARRVDENHVFNLSGLSSIRVLGIVLDLANSVLILGATIFVVADRASGSLGGTAGLSLSYALSLPGLANMMVRMLNEFEVNSVAIERAKEYTEVAQEAAWNLDPKPAPEWPESGQIDIQTYSTRYREGLELVLKDLSLSVKPMEKVGICGRTGAGKSSMTLALFRLIEAANGRICIDGQEIGSLGLHQLRSRLTILPQEPVIFSGSVRFNLDPFSEKNDVDIWHALELAHLKEYFESVTDNDGKQPGLSYLLTEGGGNLSVGQRQLLCLARAVLRRTKVLVLDEATAAVDYETDSLIQQTIRSEFKNCTVLTIAHRINTILDSDKILVLDHGRVKEYDSPANLLAKGESSTFFQMVAQAGNMAKNLSSQSS